MAYTWQQALDVTDPSGSVYKDEIPYTPNQSGSGMAAVYYKIWSAGYSILFSGERYTLGENDPTNLLPGWNEQDVFVSCPDPLQKFSNNHQRRSEQYIQSAI